MHCTSVGMRRFVIAAATVAAAILPPIAAAQSGAATDKKDISEQIFDAMVAGPGVKAGYRVAHAKGIVCEGTFVPSTEAARISKAAHFQGAPVPVTIRFSEFTWTTFGS